MALSRRDMAPDPVTVPDESSRTGTGHGPVADFSTADTPADTGITHGGTGFTALLIVPELALSPCTSNQALDPESHVQGIDFAGRVPDVDGVEFDPPGGNVSLQPGPDRSVIKWAVSSAWTAGDTVAALLQKQVNAPGQTREVRPD